MSNAEDASNWRTDFDGDGSDDSTAFDRNRDGVADAFVFDDASQGRFALVDVDGDSEFDAALIDVDDDGTFDAAHVDSDDGGDFETLLSRQSDGSFSMIDLAPSDEPVVGPPDPDSPSNGPIVAPPVEETTDDTDDDRLDDPQNVTIDPSVVVPPIIPEPETPQVLPDPGNTGPSPDGMAGDPDSDAARWFYQVDNGLCMPASVTQIVVEMTNGQVTFEQVQEMAIERGWLSKGEDEAFMTDKGYGWSGMTTANGEQLLEAFGVNAEIVHNVSPSDLAVMLDGGYDVIATIDGDEIWGGTDDDGVDGGFEPNHALVITGIDVARGVVVVNDPGDVGGQAHEYPLEQFLDAWSDSGFQAIVATPPAGAVMDDVQHGALDLLRSESPGAVLLPVVLDRGQLR